jgi:hypothetical protein
LKTTDYIDVDIPVGYKLVIAENVGLDLYGNLNFGADSDTGFKRWIQAEGGDAILESTANGLKLSSSKPAGSFLDFDTALYCAAGKEVLFSGNPLTVRTRPGSISTISNTHDARRYSLIPGGSGGVKMTASGAKVTFGKEAGGTISGSGASLTIARDGGGSGTLSIMDYPWGRSTVAPDGGLIGLLEISISQLDLGGSGGDYVGRLKIGANNNSEQHYAVGSLDDPAGRQYPARLIVKAGSVVKAGSATLITGTYGYTNTSETADVFIDSRHAAPPAN